MSTALKKERKLERPPRGGMATMVEAIRAGIWEEMERDPTVFLIGEDVGAYGGAFKVTEGIIDHFGKERVIDTPISEAAIVGAACGAGLMGMKPVAEFQFIDFISCGFDLLTNYAAKCRYRWGGKHSGGVSRPVRFRCSLRSVSFVERRNRSFSTRPGLKIVEPSTAYDAKGLIKAAIRDPDPVLYFEHKKLYRLPRLREELPEDDYIVEIGKARTAREGRDVSIITFGAQVLTALDAAEELEKEGLDVEVIDLRTLAPLDKEAILASVKKTGRALILHEASLTGGIGGEIAAIISQEAFEWLDAPVVRRGLDRYAGALFAPIGRLLFAAGKRCSGRRAQAGGLLNKLPRRHRGTENDKTNIGCVSSVVWRLRASVSLWLTKEKTCRNTLSNERFPEREI